MILIYCKSHHGVKELCKECSELQEYAIERLVHCPVKENRPVCSKCKIHCYKTDYREKIKKVMRFSGPRMLVKHPILALYHLYRMIRI